MLDYSLVAHLDAPTIWFSLPSELESRLAALPEVHDRALASVHFAYRVEVGREYLGVLEERETPIREAYFRAALAEFTSLPEAAERDFAAKGSASRPPRQTELRNPLFHAFRLLRHFNVHLQRSTFSIGSRPARIQMADQIHDVDFTLWLVDNFSVHGLSSLRDAKHYSKSELDILVQWFNKQQREWGVLHMLLLATRYYCEELLGFLPEAV